MSEIVAEHTALADEEHQQLRLLLAIINLAEGTPQRGTSSALGTPGRQRSLPLAGSAGALAPTGPACKASHEGDNHSYLLGAEHGEGPLLNMPL
jgi:hypothetical protein